jgi:hypothetical protein
MHVWEAQGYRTSELALRILGGLFVLVFVAYATRENWISARKAKATTARLTPQVPPHLSELEARNLICIYPAQGTATAWLDSPANLRMTGCMVMHNCSQEPMKVGSLQNLRITLGQSTTLFSSHRIDIGVEVAPKTYPQHLFSIDLDKEKAEKILSLLHGVSACGVVQIFMAGEMTFIYREKESKRSVSMEFITEARR